MTEIIWDLRIDKVINAVKEGKRLDGRGFDAYREIEIQKNFSQNADGSARVKLGDTEVVAGVKMLPMLPFPDLPEEGTISVGVELLPLASPTFETGPPKEEAIELARVVDRSIRESKTLNFNELCIREKELSWTVFIDVYALNDNGNLFDCSSIAAFASLLETKMPKLEEDKIVKGEYKGKLKLSRKPVLCTFWKIANSVVLDANTAEEKASTARFSLSTTEDGFIPAFQKGGSGSFSLQELNQAIDIAFKKGSEVRKIL